MDPSFTRINREIRTVLRWYDSESLKNANRRECVVEMEECPYTLLSPNDSLLAFQFARPNSVLGITSWGIYDSDGALVYDITADVGNIEITPFSTYDYLTYDREVISEIMEEGTYHSRITTDGNTYYSEDFTVPCQTFGLNMFYDPPFADGFLTGDNQDAHWYVSNWARILTAVKNTAGAPTDPAHAYEGSQVANTNENTLYTYTSGVWVQSTPGTTTGWYDSQTGNWYRFNAGAWQGLVTDPITMDENGICYDGVSFPAQGPTVSVDIGSLGGCASEVVMQFEFTITGMTQGQVTIASDDYGGMLVEDNGTYMFTAYVANGYLWHFVPGLNFDGCISDVKLRCPNAMETCCMKLSATNCGNVGNTYYGTGMTQVFFFPQECPRPVPQPTLFIDEEEQDDGSTEETFRRKGTLWTLHAGFHPWFVADALTDMALHDTIKLNLPIETGAGDFLAQTLTNVQVLTEPDPEVSDCLTKVTITFEIDNTAVSCCDDFDPPCLTSCTVVVGFDNDLPLLEGEQYAFRNAPRYAIYQGGSFQPYSVCTTGLITVDADGDGADYTAYWNVNDNEWSPVALQTVQTTEDTDPCTLLLRYAVQAGYRGVLEVLPTGQLGWEETDLDLSALEWATNTETWEAPASSGEIRLKVYIGDCVIGYSEVSSFGCS